MTATRFAIALWLCLGLAGCGSLAGDRKESLLENTLNQYRTAMRWGHWDTLMAVRPPKAPRVSQQVADNIRVTDYEVRQPPVAVGKDRVRQVVEIEYVLNDRQLVHRLYDKQEWRYDADGRVWRLYSPFPEFR